MCAAGFTDLIIVMSVHTYRYSIIFTVRFDYINFPFTSATGAVLDPLPKRRIADRKDHTHQSKGSVILVDIISSRPTDALCNT